eukprot:TRINITY_DN6525_c0_g2_i1.p1 TRINITY_DN6525_c0_g2~~TRINITY_DN6525_c0_g2_i1.p1  ORF type:complete len:357 (+),score=141.30 TRINITY_DN6525_c0_g2_i1:68-1138(+)
MQSLLRSLALCVAGAAAVSTNHGSVQLDQIRAGAGLAALEKAEESIFLKKRPAHPHSEESEPPQEVQQEVETMMKRVEKTGNKGLLKEYVSELEGVEANLADRVGAAGSFASKQLVDEVANMRAQLCQEQGFERHESKDCVNFMRVACNLDGNATASQASSAVSFATCQKFFQENRREKGEDEEKDEDEGEDKKDGEQEGTEEKKEEEAAEKKEEPAAAEGEAAAAEGEGGNATSEEAGAEEGLFGGKVYRKLPVSGYNEYQDGKLVMHSNLETQTEDWQKESRGRNIEQICKEFPNNQWCQLHTHEAEEADEEEKGGAPAPVPFQAPKSGTPPAAALPAALTGLVTVAALSMVLS